ncbi:division/cell wall cluster transcriptional repressor MraZ [Rhizobium sp. TH2]|uniref:division/cell wall cluster transcriptional repressor MraZ n=1 Tax=Rhizobium sp. TH2 TaxID=2775403 RepID=UPI002157E30C|nr:division/cell wall cluster transcriptional repressor MraZ [Rhizobium sp. TH2]UVC06883.1 division/cell wall cluster transcriptional repressor MraZ [Rhizobium sp. TH2]
MSRFLSSATNRIDAKGRVSVPAPFRTALASLGIEELYCFQDFHFPAINIGGPDLLMRFERQLENLDPFSLEANRISLVVHGGGVFMRLDSEGRLSVTDFIRSHTRIAGEVTFAGRSDYFQLWRPEDFSAAQMAAREELRKRGLSPS